VDAIYVEGHTAWREFDVIVVVYLAAMRPRTKKLRIFHFIDTFTGTVVVHQVQTVVFVNIHTLPVKSVRNYLGNRLWVTNLVMIYRNFLIRHLTPQR
jgi:hypothetical protein